MTTNAGIGGKLHRLSIPTNMETDLNSAESVSIDQIEIDLLGNLTAIQDDGSLVMTDELLDCDLKSMALNQSG